MSLYKEIIGTINRLGALETRTQDVRLGLERIENKLDGLLERITKVEVELPALRQNIKSEILGDIKAEIVETKLLLQIETERAKQNRAFLTESDQDDDTKET